MSDNRSFLDVANGIPKSSTPLTPLPNTLPNTPSLRPPVQPMPNVALNNAIQNSSPDNLTPVDINANRDLIQKILQDTDNVLTLLDKNDQSIKNLSDKAESEKERLETLKIKISTMETTEETLRKKINELENDNTTLREQVENGTSGSSVLKEQLDKCQVKLQKYKDAAERSHERLVKIQEKISNISNVITTQGSVIDNLNNTMSGGARKPKTTNTVRKELGYFKVIDSLQNAKRSKLDSMAKKLGLNPKNYRNKQDIFIAISLVLHAKFGIVKRMRDVKIIASNLGIKAQKDKKQLCKELSKKLRGISLKNLKK